MYHGNNVLLGLLSLSCYWCFLPPAPLDLRVPTEPEHVTLSERHRTVAFFAIDLVAMFALVSLCVLLALL